MDIRTFDRAALLAALEPPRFQDGQERAYVGRILSAAEWFRYEERLQRMGELSIEEGAAFRRELIDVFFPPPPRWRRWLRGERSVSDLVETLPYRLQLDALLSFVHAQATAQQWTTPGRTPTPESPPTPGSDSPG